MIRRTIAALATATALLLASAPASASDERDWSTRLPCASGDIAHQWHGHDDLARPTTWLAGWIRPCGRAGASERFGFVYYVRGADTPETLGYFFHDRLRRYGPGRTWFAGTIDPTVEEFNGTLIGVCLAHAPGRLVDCAQPSPRPPLPPIQELARLPVAVTDPAGPEPNCATCV